MAGRTSTPNILFLFTDQQRPDWHGRNPDIPVETPTMDRLADRGVQFTNAICPSPVCNPSRASIASGMEYDRCGVLGNDADFQPTELPPLARRLRDDGGYHTMGCGKFDLTSGFPFGREGSPAPEWGYEKAVFNPAKVNTAWSVKEAPERTPQDPYTAYLDEHGWLAAHVEDYIDRHDQGWWPATEPTPLPDEMYYDNWITRQGMDLLRDAPADDPWFLQVNFQNPHHPWDITESMHERYRSPPVSFPEPVHSDLDVEAETHQEIRRNYSAMVTHLDECMERLIGVVEERGELENTVIVVSSDHGEMLGDYGQWQKLSPLQMSIGVPLVVAGAGVAAQEPREEPTTILDLHATFCDLAGVPVPETLDSRSLTGALTDDDAFEPRDVVYSGLSAWRLVFDGQYKLIEGYDPAERRGGDYPPMQVPAAEAHRLQADREPLLVDVTGDERKNLAAARPDLRRQLHERLVAIRDGEA